MTLTIVETRAITGGVDTHADVHVAAALDPIGGLLGVEEFPATPAGYARLLAWLGGFGTVCLVGIEGTGSYGAGLARHVTAAGIRWSRSTAPTARTGGGRANLIRWMPSAPPGRPSPGGRAALRGAGMALSRQPGR
jgi:transposase